MYQQCHFFSLQVGLLKYSFLVDLRKPVNLCLYDLYLVSEAIDLQIEMLYTVYVSQFMRYLVL